MASTLDDPVSTTLWKKILQKLNDRVVPEKRIPPMQGDSQHALMKKALQLLDDAGL